MTDLAFPVSDVSVGLFASDMIFINKTRMGMYMKKKKKTKDKVGRHNGGVPYFIVCVCV